MHNLFYSEDTGNSIDADNAPDLQHLLVVFPRKFRKSGSTYSYKYWVSNKSMRTSADKITNYYVILILMPQTKF